jgi:SAM-dependent methyltransferase
MLKQEFTDIRNTEKFLIESTGIAESFSVDGFCQPCGKKVSFLVDMQYSVDVGRRIPNWRERLVCPFCQLNNRQRSIAALTTQHIKENGGANVYFMEQVTPIYRWAVDTFPKHKIIGSEYLGHGYASGEVIKGIRHEDAENLSFANEDINLIVSNDVFEHVLDPQKSFAECARVLKPGGVLLATIPFNREYDISVTRANFVNGELIHLLPAVYHGNPMSADGSLVFTDFGWDMLNIIKSSGFTDVHIGVYASKKYGYFLGGGNIIFFAIK